MSDFETAKRTFGPRMKLKAPDGRVLTKCAASMGAWDNLAARVVPVADPRGARRRAIHLVEQGLADEIELYARVGVIRRRGDGSIAYDQHEVFKLEELV